MKKILRITIIMFILIILNNSILLASDVPDASFYNPFSDSTKIPEKFSNKIGMIANMLKVVGISIAVIGVAIIGVKYMVGSVESKAEYKNTIILWILGVAFIFLTGEILKIINDVTNGTLK